MATLEAELEALQAREVELLQQQPQQSISAAQEEERSAAASSQGAHAAFDSQSLNWDHIVVGSWTPPYPPNQLFKKMTIFFQPCSQDQSCLEQSHEISASCLAGEVPLRAQ